VFFDDAKRRSHWQNGQCSMDLRRWTLIEVKLLLFVCHTGKLIGEILHFIENLLSELVSDIDVKWF